MNALELKSISCKYCARMLDSEYKGDPVAGCFRYSNEVNPYDRCSRFTLTTQEKMAKLALPDGYRQINDQIFRPDGTLVISLEDIEGKTGQNNNENSQRDVKSPEEWAAIIANGKRMAEEGNVEAMKGVALLIRVGRNSNENNWKEALPYYRMAADRGDAESAEELGTAYFLVEDIKNDVLAFKYSKQAADAGRPNAQYKVGLMSRIGAGVNTDLNMAIEYFKRASLQNHSGAQYALYETMMATRVPERDDDIDASVHNMKITIAALHWLACAYVNGDEEAIERVRLLNLRSNSVFNEKINSIMKNGPDPDKQDRPQPANTNASRSSQSRTTQKSGCYIATSVYGSYDCPQVWTLRRYRDFKMSKTWYGRAFIKMYYATSPTIVKWFGNEAWFNRFWKVRLDKMVKRFNKEGISNTPYIDL